MNNLKYFLFAFLFPLLLPAQTYSDFYSFDMCTGSYMYWSHFYLLPYKGDTVQVSGEKPFFRYATESFNGVYLPLRACQEQTVLLPDGPKKNCEVAIRYKNSFLPQASLRVILYDQSQKMLEHYETPLRTDMKRVSLNVSVADVASLKISIQLSDTTTVRKELDLYGIDMRIDGRDINSFPLNQGYASDVDLTCLKKGLPEIPDKRIIGIGENMHGTSTLWNQAFDIIKDRILHHRCRLVMLEFAPEMIISDNYLIMGEKSGQLPDSLLLPSFKEPELLSWIKEYNRTAERKVIVAGVDNNDVYANEFRYLLYCISLLENDSSLKELSLLSSKNFYKEIEKNEKVWNHFTPEDQFILRHTLSRHSLIDETSRKRNMQSLRDSIMAENVTAFLEHFCEEGESAVIWGHYGHIGKLCRLNRPYDDVRSLGNILQDKYSDDYYCLGLFGMEGTRYCYPTPDLIYYQNVNSSGFSPSSIEYRLKDSFETCWLPSEAFPDKDVLTNFSGSVVLSYGNRFLNLRRSSDAVAYIRHVDAPTNIPYFRNVKKKRDLLYHFQCQYLMERFSKRN